MIASLTLPLSALELQEAVRGARRFDLARLDRVLRLEVQRNQVEVQASASWQSLAARIASESERAALAACPMTIGESLAVNSAGPDGAPLVGHVESIALVMPEGELRRVSRESAPKLFALVIGGQGLFGVPYSVTLRVESLLDAARQAVSSATLTLPSARAETSALELFVPPAEAERFLGACRARCAEWRVPLHGVQVNRTLAEDETMLRWARREYAAVTLHLQDLSALGGAVRATQLRRQLIDSAIQHGGSFAIASTPEATREHVEACYPELKTLLAEKRRFDPEEKLSTPWYRHHRSLLGREDCPVRWNR
jgi:FAD/FMN-containing dehydrogenase